MLPIISCAQQSTRKTVIEHTDIVEEADPNEVLAKRSKEEITVNYNNAPWFEMSFPDSSIHSIKLKGRYLVKRDQPITIPKALLPPEEKSDFATFQFNQVITLYQDGQPQSTIIISKEMYDNHLPADLKKYGVLRQVGTAGYSPKDSSWHFQVAIGIPMTTNARSFEFSISRTGKFKSSVSVP